MTSPPAKDSSALTISATDLSKRFNREWIFRRLNYEFSSGKRYAITGPNGSGKTTLIKLLTRLYPPTSGRILLDGRDLQEWDEVALRQRIGVIFQDFVRYHLTAAENIAVGRIEARGG